MFVFSNTQLEAIGFIAEMRAALLISAFFGFFDVLRVDFVELRGVLGPIAAFTKMSRVDFTDRLSLSHSITFILFIFIVILQYMIIGVLKIILNIFIIITQK